jgi:hypothetical protein
MMRSVDVAIVGAGPYGLSLAAHLHSRGVDARVFGEPMRAWKNNMPAGMLLKSYPWASNLSDAESTFTAKRFYTEQGLPYDVGDRGLTLIVRLLYGCAFSGLCYGYLGFWSKHVNRLACDRDGFEIETLINVRALKNKLKIVEVASFESSRIHGLSNLRAIPDGFRILTTILRERLSPYLPIAEPVRELGKQAPSA